MPRNQYWKRFSDRLGSDAYLERHDPYGVHAIQNPRAASNALRERAGQDRLLADSTTDPAKLDEAISLLDQYLKMKPKDEDAYRRFAKLSLDRAKADPKQANNTAAGQAGEALYASSLTRPDERRQLIDLYLEVGHLQGARQHIRILFDGRGDFKNDVDLLDKAATCWSSSALGDIAKGGRISG